MKTVFVNGSHDTQLGIILNGVYEKSATERKSRASQIHFEIYNLLTKYSLSLKDIDTFVGLVGPGSYTGVKLIHSIGKSLEVFGIKNLNFTYLDFLNWYDGARYWVSYAYKNQFFVYDKVSKEKILISEDDPLPEGSVLTSRHEKKIAPKKSIIYFEDIWDKFASDFIGNIITREKDCSPFYYRSLLEEFNRK